MIYRLTFTMHTDKDHYPVVVQVAIGEELAKVIQGQRLTNITAKIEKSPGYVSHTPLLSAKGEHTIQ